MINSYEEDLKWLKNRIEQLEKEQEVKVQVDKDNLDDIEMNDLYGLAKAYGLSLRELFNP